jgi:hypothetical protein
VDTGWLLSKGIGWLSWKQLKRILEITRGQFRTGVERKFMKDLILYLKSNFEGLTLGLSLPVFGGAGGDSSPGRGAKIIKKSSDSGGNRIL